MEIEIARASGMIKTHQASSNNLREIARNSGKVLKLRELQGSFENFRKTAGSKEKFLEHLENYGNIRENSKISGKSR